MRLFLSFIVVKHFIWSLLLFVTPETQTTITASVYPLEYLAFGDPLVLAIEYLIISIAVIVALMLKTEEKITSSPIAYFTGLFIGLLQQVLITVSAAGSAVAIIQGKYLDGTQISIGHLLGDQDIYLLLAIFHIAALVSVYVVPVLKLSWNQ